jgi:hypothetical protein
MLSHPIPQSPAIDMMDLAIPAQGEGISFIQRSFIPG